MKALLVVVRYPLWLAWAGFLSMAFFRLPLFFNKKITFYKLMGSGKNGTFDAVPDLQQWAIMVAIKPAANVNNSSSNIVRFVLGNFIHSWFKFFKAKQWAVVMEPIEGHGKWDGREVFGQLPRSTDYEGMIAVLTRATIRINKLRNFWKHVAGAAAPLQGSPGFIHSIGIGEVPWVKQATFSIWQSKQSMKQYAYKMQQHQVVIQKTRKENWYSEEMFVRFKILASYGDLPVQDILIPYLQKPMEF